MTDVGEFGDVQGFLDSGDVGVALVLLTDIGEGVNVINVCVRFEADDGESDGRGDDHVGSCPDGSTEKWAIADGEFGIMCDVDARGLDEGEEELFLRDNGFGRNVKVCEG